MEQARQGVGDGEGMSGSDGNVAETQGGSGTESWPSAGGPAQGYDDQQQQEMLRRNHDQLVQMMVAAFQQQQAGGGLGAPATAATLSSAMASMMGGGAGAEGGEEAQKRQQQQREAWEAFCSHITQFMGEWQQQQQQLPKGEGHTLANNQNGEEGDEIQQQRRELIMQSYNQMMKMLSASFQGHGNDSGEAVVSGTEAATHELTNNNVMIPVVIPPEAVVANIDSCLPFAAAAAAAAATTLADQPIFVNARQYKRIMKRREARAKLEKKMNFVVRSKDYMHMSRHLHANRRKRGPGGRFLTKAELMALKEKEEVAGQVNAAESSPSGEGTGGSAKTGNG